MPAIFWLNFIFWWHYLSNLDDARLLAMPWQPVSPSEKSCFGSQSVDGAWTGLDGLLTTLFEDCPKWHGFFVEATDRKSRWARFWGLECLNFFDAPYITCKLTFHILDPLVQIGSTLWVLGLIFTIKGSSRVGLSITVLVRRDIYTVTKGWDLDPVLGS